MFRGKQRCRHVTRQPQLAFPLQIPIFSIIQKPPYLCKPGVDLSRHLSFPSPSSIGLPPVSFPLSPTGRSGSIRLKSFSRISLTLNFPIASFYVVRETNSFRKEEPRKGHVPFSGAELGSRRQIPPRPCRFGGARGVLWLFIWSSVLRRSLPPWAGRPGRGVSFYSGRGSAASSS